MAEIKVSKAKISVQDPDGTWREIGAGNIDISPEERMLAANRLLVEALQEAAALPPEGKAKLASMLREWAGAGGHLASDAMAIAIAEMLETSAS